MTTKGKNKDLLKEAIADAKAVRETALKNAKLALEEAFTPKLQSMLSAKLQKEVDGDDELENDDDIEQITDTEIETENDDLDLDDEVPAEEPTEEPVAEEEIPTEEPVEDEEELDLDLEDEPVEEETEPSDIGKGDNKQPVKQPETEDPGKGKLSEEGEELPNDEDDLELEAMIKELEGEEELDLDIEDDTEEPVAEEIPVEEPAEAPVDDDEDVDITMDELYSALKEMDNEEEAPVEEPTDAPDAEAIAALEKENEELEKELGEAYKVIKFMKSKLNEVNLINAKLLFTNKLFKAFNLTTEDKVKVVETLDRAQNAREAKLVFVTLAESYNKGKVKPVQKPLNKSVKKLTENIASASKSQASTKPKAEILNEANDMVARFSKLAGLNKKK